VLILGIFDLPTRDEKGATLLITLALRFSTVEDEPSKVEADSDDEGIGMDDTPTSAAREIAEREVAGILEPFRLRFSARVGSVLVRVTVRLLKEWPKACNWFGMLLRASNCCGTLLRASSLISRRANTAASCAE
jgi:hypothetical protein